jgi:hypothetical protein
MKTWEYKIHRSMELISNISLNAFGEDGWELICSINTPLGIFHYIFKRELK